MNTPAHVALNALLLGRNRWRPHWFAITAGALLPDLPMFAFYGIQKFAFGTNERAIWSSAYFEPGWQLFFDLFNSLPLIAVGAAIAWRIGATRWLAFFASMALHCVADLPLHREDAHSHFLPFTSWRFESPVSYWDPAHYGLWFGAAEILLVGIAGVALRRFAPPRAWSVIGGICALLYLLFGAFALAMWSDLGGAA